MNSAVNGTYFGQEPMNDVQNYEEIIKKWVIAESLVRVNYLLDKNGGACLGSFPT